MDYATICAPFEDIKFHLGDCRSLTVGELRRRLAKFPASQPIYFQDDEGGLEPIRYAELHEWK